MKDCHRNWCFVWVLQIGERVELWPKDTSVVGMFLNGKMTAWVYGKAKSLVPFLIVYCVGGF